METQDETTKEVEMLDKNDYYKDNSHISFSGLKVFSKCETLYRDMFVTKTYEEPEHDYFVYGKLVDAFITESPEFIAKNFIQVERKINPEDALKFENKIKELQAEIESPEFQEKLAKGNKVALKGLESRTRKIEEIKISLDAIKDLSDKQQVTPSVWENAEQTSLAIKSHPYFSNMEFNTVTSQQIFQTTIDGIPMKGRLDYLKLSPALTKIYAIYKSNHMSLDEMKDKIRELNPNDLWASIIDIKTCYDIEKLEPYNTHYRGQLGFYQDLVSDVLLIPIKNIKCYILVADKLSNEFKKAELFEYTQESLDELKPDVREWAKIWLSAMLHNRFVSSKVKNGIEQKCFTCSECRFCPFSANPGQPYLVTGPRFGSNKQDVSNPGSGLSDFSTVEAALEY